MENNMEHFYKVFKLPNSKNYEIAVDERGIILEGPVDPLLNLDLDDVCLIYRMTDKLIDTFVNERFKNS
jgi:hypothetical protein